MIDKHSGQVRYAVLEFGGFLGMGTELYPMPWSMLKYDTAKGGYVAPRVPVFLGPEYILQN